MTLNFSHQPVFPMNPPNDSFSSSSMRFDDRFIMDGFYDFGSDKTDKGGGSFSEPNDVIDLLPADPFGMNMGATFTAITGWLDIIEMDALNYIWNNTMKLPLEPGNFGTNGSFSQTFQFGLWLNEEGSVDHTLNGCSSSKGYNTHADAKVTSKTCGDNAGRCLDRSGGDPHEALMYVLGYLGVSELLSVERACKSLHSAVQNDPLLWRNICIDQPLNERIDDEALMWLTSRAQGNLQSLSMVNCSRVTDDGLKIVLQCNTRLQKLSVPYCTRLSIEGIVNNLRELQSSGALDLKLLRIGGRYDVTKEHFEDLNALLGIDQHMQKLKSTNSRIYHGGHSSFSYDHNEDCVIDIEMCPRCENPRLIYDCPVDNCLGSSPQSCRACTICISRCVQCGRCVNDGEYVETFCLDILCLHCCQQQPDMIERMGAYFKQKKSDFIYVCG